MVGGQDVPSQLFSKQFSRVEKYRPVTLDDVVSHKDITSTSESSMHRTFEHILTASVPVEKFIEKNRLPHLLFYGPPGTGKTSTILAVARRIYGTDFRKQILEVGADAQTCSLSCTDKRCS
jgi:replication factor C subunit 3/5